MTGKEKIIIDGANILKEKINMCFILLLNKLETTETIERTIYEHLDAFVDEWNDLFQRKKQECERLKWYLKEIRYDELKALDIEWDEYETHCIDSEYSNIINLVEEALKERSSEDCRYDR